MNGNLNDEDITLVCNVIASRTGLQFPVERWALLRRNLVLAARDFGYDNINRFAVWLLSSDLNKEQIETLASFLTSSETYFWREPKVFSALTDFILPELAGSKQNEKKTYKNMERRLRNRRGTILNRNSSFYCNKEH